MTRWGVNNDWGIHGMPRWVGSEAYRVAKASGLQIVRYTVYWPLVAPAPNRWEFDALDRDINAMRAAGLKILLNIMWAPAWVTENGNPTFDIFACRNIATPETPAGGIGADFDKSIPWCGKPDRIREGAIWGICQKLMGRYEDRVDYWSFWNEPNYPIFYPPREFDTANEYVRYMKEIAMPSSDALRYYAKGPITIVGPEPDDAGTLRTLLEAERYLIGRNWRSHDGGGRLWDVIGAHCYSWTHGSDGMRVVPDGVISRLRSEFLPVVKEYRDGREFWITETGANEVKGTAEGLLRQSVEVPGLAAALDAEPEVDAVLLYRLKRESNEIADHGLVMTDDRPSPALTAIKGLIA